MALKMNFDFGQGNEYMADAEQAMNQARRDKQTPGGGGPSPIAVVLDLLGIGRQAAKPPKEETPETEKTVVTDKKGNVLDVVEEVVSTTGDSTNVQRLPLAPLEIDPANPLNFGRLPRPLTQIDPNDGLLR